MADLSILEFIVYAVIGYSPMIFLLGYILTDKVATRSNSIMRIVYVMPGMAGIIMLISVGGFDVIVQEDTINNTIFNVNTTETHTETIATESVITLQNPLWVTFNGIMFIIYTLYVVINAIELIALKE